METEDEMESRLLLDVVIGEGAAVFKLLSGENAGPWLLSFIETKRWFS